MQHHGRIDVHFHQFPDFYKQELLARGPQTTSGVYPEWSPEWALDLMDTMGIAAAVTSLSYPGVYFGDAAAAGKLARRCNDHAADLIEKWPGRFGGLAALPLPDVDGALSETRRCFDELKLDGVILLASHGGKFLGDPSFDPLMEELDRRHVVALIHPGLHPGSAALDLPWPGFMMEFLFDTSRAAVNLLFSGALERYPNIKFILSHAGGVIPYIAWRLGAAPQISKRVPNWPRERIAALLRRFWYDTALAPGMETFGSLRQVADPARIVFGSDAPFAPPAVIAEGIAQLARAEVMSDAERLAVERDNGLALFPRFAK
jgi:predicted TIM-barrel fold metal-dependent hydrolase